MKLKERYNDNEEIVHIWRGLGDDVAIASFDAFSAKCDISPKFTRGRIERIVQLLPSAAKATAEELSDAGHPSGVFGRIADQIACRINQLSSS